MFTEKKATEERLLPFYNKLKNAWCKESCSPLLREKWQNGNVALGQCFVTAVAVRDTFGGDIFELHISEEIIHYYNIIDEEIVDLSSEQFKEHITSDFYRNGIPSDVSLLMKDPIKKKRYEALICRMKDFN